MKTVKCFIASLVMILFSLTVSGAQDTGWPRQRTENGNTLITYQPQVDDWRDFRELDWRMAISLTPAGGKPVLGVVELHGQTIVDNDNKMVLINILKIKRTHFPSLDPTTEAQMDLLARRFLPPAVTITLYQLAACVPKPESVQGVQLNNDPPGIYVSYKPAILLDVDGKPVRASIPNGKLEYDLKPLSKMTSLKRLHIGNTPVSDLTPLTGLRLERLVFTPEDIKKGLDGIRNMKTLTEIGSTLDTLMPAKDF